MSDQSQTFLANQEHSGISGVMPLIWLGGLGVSYYAAYSLFPLWLGGQPTDYLILSGLAAIPLASVLVLMIDPLLKNIWPSGHLVTLEDTAVIYDRPNGDEITIDVSRPYRLLRWSFKLGETDRVGRERQIKHSWFCCGCQLQQDNARITMHAYMPPKQYEELPGLRSFRKLDLTQIYDDSLTARWSRWRQPSDRPKMPPDLITSDNGPYWLAERNRWRDGVELTPADFNELCAYVENHKGTATEKTGPINDG